MKILVVGATGFVGTEVIRQALSIPAITSIVGVARRESKVPEKLLPGADASKFKALIVPDFKNYSKEAKAELLDADACIWTVAVLPRDLKKMSPETIREICYDYTVASLDVFTSAPRPAGKKPVKFIYMSGSNSARDPAKKPWIMGDYSVLRGEVERKTLAYGRQYSDRLQSFVVKPGVITSYDRPISYAQQMFLGILKFAIALPTIPNSNVAASCLSLAMEGSSTYQDTLTSAEMDTVGQEFAKKHNIEP